MNSTWRVSLSCESSWEVNNVTENKNIPRIRFEGFTDPWEQRKLGENCTFAKGRGYSKADIRKSGTPLILYGRLYTQYQSRIDIVDTYADMQDDSVLSKGAEVIVPASGETAEDIAVAASVRSSGILLGGDLNVITPGARIDPDFLALEITYGEAHNKLAKCAQGKSVVHIHNEDIADVDFVCPELAEQRTIATTIHNLDSLIALHQRKYEKLQKLKKSMLDKMFPKPGELYPEIRFEGFTDPWEQRKLGEVACIVGGGTPNTGIHAYWDGDIDWYSPAELGERIYADGSVRKITQAGYDSCSAIMLPANKTILFTSRAGIGNVAILRRPACTNQGFQSLIVDDDADVYFVYSMAGAIKKYAEQKASGSTFLEISGKSLAAGEFAFPAKYEQIKIGSAFRCLDSLITLHQRKLELLKNIKKSLLDRMFV